MKISIVATLYNSAGTLEEFCARALAAAGKIAEEVELVLVDDGSSDNSLDIARDLIAKDSRVVAIELSRNFGHHKAMMTGLEHTKGDLVFLIDSDLEENPELVVDFYEALKERSADVIYGFQGRRKGSLIERLGGDIAYRFFNLLVPYPVPRNHITVRLMRRAYVDALLLHRERETAIGGLWVITGFKQFGLQVNKGSRDSSSYSALRRWRLLIESVASFSEIPLVAIFYLGIAISTLSTVVGIWLISRKLLFDIQVAGWVSVMLSVWFLGGLLVFCIGIIGIYLSKIFIETKNRPYTIIREIYRNDDKK